MPENNAVSEYQHLYKENSQMLKNVVGNDRQDLPDNMSRAEIFTTKFEEHIVPLSVISGGRGFHLRKTA